MSEHIEKEKQFDLNHVVRSALYIINEVSFNFVIKVVYAFLIRYQSWEVNGKLSMSLWLRANVYSRNNGRVHTDGC